MLIKHFFEFEMILEVSLIAQFSDYIAVPVTGKDLITFEYTGMVEFFEYLNLLEKQLLEFFRF